MLLVDTIQIFYIGLNYLPSDILEIPNAVSTQNISFIFQVKQNLAKNSL